MAKRVAIIGSGASGIAAIKSCLEEDMIPVCLERTDRIGGLWYYTKDVSDGQGCVMKTTVINTSKEIMCYSDYPIPADFPVFMHNTKVVEYLKAYAKSFQSEKYTRFNTEVLKVQQSADHDTTGRWTLTVKDKATDKTTEEEFDAVMVCSGHHADKNIPTFEGLDSFKGKVTHTHDYRDHVGYENKKVVVIGIGNSGGDVAVELSRIAGHVTLSTRRGSWVLNRISNNGYPADLLIIRRIATMFQNIMPRSIFNFLAESFINRRFDHANYNLKPKHRFDAQHPMVNDELPNRIACGTVIIKPDIRRITETGVEYVDGSVDDNVDAIILATGFSFGFPFVDHPALEVKKNQIDLYKYVFPPDLRRNTLAVIGFIQPVGAIMPISEIQCRWAARVFNKLNPLPGKDIMMLDIETKRKTMCDRYVESPRHTIQVEYITIMDEIGEHFGAKPDLGKLMWEDPILAWRCFFGPFVPYQYRLMGPGKWDGARNAVMTVWDRTLQATRPGHKIDRKQTNYLVLAIGVLIMALLFRWFLSCIL